MNQIRKLTPRLLIAAACFSTPHKGTSVKDKNILNVFGKPLISCGENPKTGYYRDGFCSTGAEDSGIHVVCAVVTTEFLEFSKRKGNDLITPRPEYDFKGLKQGDRWCLCASRWKEAFDANVAPPVILESTHQKALDIISMKNLETKCQK
ncbi:MAG: DUF2237 domain-containing protein [Bdellovibrio sp.]|nr:DUF2237 domain-containing protein [Bdellovibrio sp.]